MWLVNIVMRLIFHINYYQLTGTQFLRIREAFENDSSANIKLSKTQLAKMVQLGRILFTSGSSQLIEGSLANSFPKRFIKKNLINSKKDFKNLAIDVGFDVIG